MVTRKVSHKNHVTSIKMSMNASAKVNSMDDAKNDLAVDNKKDIRLFTRKNMMTIPNLLTASRIFIAPFFIFTILNGRYIAALILLAVASLTDFFDGLIARKFNMQSDFGRMLDPIADKVLIFCAVLALLLKFGFPLWLCIIIISRDLFILLAGLLFIILGMRSELKPNLAGKVSTFFQMVSLTAYVLGSILGYYGDWIGVLLYMTAAMTILSGLIYIIEGYKMLRVKR
ncbi:MAG: CDP-diacylglycerol--glycerol-3-phosphate 3-phosphatidyltransferase [Candidatus Woesearchaeota archaeon]